MFGKYLKNTPIFKIFDVKHLFHRQHFRIEDTSSSEYKNMLCREHTLFGSSKLVFEDPEIPGNTITMVLAVFQETSNCVVNEETGSKGQGKFLFIL